MPEALLDFRLVNLFNRTKFVNLKKIRNAIETARNLTWENSTDRLFALYDKMYEDFSRRRELHVYEPEAERIDFAGEMFFNQQR